MIGKKINQLATELAPVSTDLTIIGDPISGVSKKITLAQLGAIFSGAVSFYTNLAGFPATGDINVIYCAKDTQKLYLWSGSAYVEVFPSQALLDTYQLRSEKGVSNGYASLDSSGKVPISQLPSSIMEYKGTWNAATNTPTLANGTGDTGDVYICNVAGTVNFGAGAITFAVGDYVIYSGSIWQRSSGAVGTVTSVGLSITGDSIGVSNSPITTSGTLALAFAGTSSQYINGAGNLTTFPSLTGFVPYTGATANVNLGTFDLTADILTAATGSYTSSGGGNTLEISHTSGSGIALNITKGGNGEGLYINKTSGTGNAATIIGTLNATTLVKSGGTSTQFLKADGSVDSSTYLTTSAAATTYLPMVLSSTANSIEINGQFFDVASAANSYTSGRLIIAPTYGAIGYQNAGVFDGLKILTNGNAEFSNSGITRFFNQVRFDSTLTNGTYTYTLPGATGTLALTSDLTGGTVTSVGLSSATSGVTIGSTPITTSGTITLAIATASGSQQGLLSSTDWTTFNNKQNALTNPVTGTGTTNYLPKFTGTSTIGNSLVQDNGSTVSIITGSTVLSLDRTGGATALIELKTGGTVRSYLGADTSMPFVFFNQAASPLMYLDASGNLGLGTSSPSVKLQVVGDGSFSGYVNANVYNLAGLTGGGALSWTTNTLRLGQDSYFQTLQFWTNGSDRMRLDASGNLGLGVTPSAWGTAGDIPTAFQFGASGMLYSYKNTSSSGSHSIFGANAYFDGSAFKYINTNLATYYRQYEGTHAWLTAPSGTAGNAISFTQAMTLDASGRLGIGTTSPNAPLTVQSNSSGIGVHIVGRSADGFGFLTFRNNANNTVNGEIGISDAQNMLFYTGASVRLTIASTGAATFSSSVTAGGLNSNNGNIFVKNDTGSAYRGISFGATVADNTEYSYIKWQPNNGEFRLYANTAGFGGFMSFYSNNSEAMRITSAGAVLMNTTTRYNSEILGVQITDSGSVSAVKAALRVSNNGSGYIPKIILTDNNLVDAYITMKANGSSDANYLSFGLGNSYNILNVLENGRVGIGTTSPSSPLSIKGSVNNTVVEFGNASTSNGYMLFFDRTASAYASGYVDALDFSVRTSATERMRITSDGNFDYGGFNVQSSNNAVYRQAFYGAMSILWRNAEDAYINSNHTYSSSNTNVASYTSTNGIGRLGLGGGFFEWLTYNGSVTAGSAYSMSTKFLITSAGNVEIAIGSIKTGAPTNGTAQPWKLGNAVSGAISTDSYIIVSVNGTTYSIPALNGLP